MVLLGSLGLEFYNAFNGAFAGSNNPTLSGGDFGGQPISSLSINTVAGVRDTSGSELILFQGVPEPSSLVLSVVGTAVLGCVAWRRRSRADQGRAREIKH